MERRRNSDVMVQTIDLAGKRVVDVGCGDGTLARLMAQRGANVVGIECSPRQLAKLRALPPVPGACFVEGVGQDLPLADGVADMVVFFNSLHHIPVDHMDQALAQAVRVLKPGGVVYVSEPLAEGPHFQACRPVDDETWVRAQALNAMLRAPGLCAKQEIRYVHEVRLPHFEAFRDRLISANPEREARFARMDETMRSLFNTFGTYTDDVWRFDQPMRVNIFIRPI